MVVKGLTIIQFPATLVRNAIQGQSAEERVHAGVLSKKLQKTFRTRQGAPLQEQVSNHIEDEAIQQKEQKEIKQKVSGVAEETKGGGPRGVWKQVCLLWGQKHRIPLYGSRLRWWSEAFQTNRGTGQILLLAKDARVSKEEVSNPLSQLQFFHRPSRVLSTWEFLMAKRIKVHEEVLEWL